MTRKQFDRLGAKVVVDSAFLAKNAPFIIKTSANVTNRTRQQIRNALSETSCRQFSEWGMRLLQGSFPRIVDRFPFENIGKRKLFIHLCVLLSNLRARRVGINQIRNVYLPHLENDVTNLLSDM